MDEYGNLVAQRFEGLEKEALRSPAYAWSQGLTEIDYTPPILYITPTNLCNHRCHICAYKSHMRRGFDEIGDRQQGVLDWDRFTRIVDRIPADVARIYFYKHGEPLLNPLFDKMAYHFRSRLAEDVEVALSTNGRILDDTHEQALIDNFNVVVLSIYALDRDTFKTLHGRDTFDRVFGNYRRFHDRYAKLDHPRLKVYFNYVRQQGNLHESDEQVADFFHRYFWAFNTGIHETFNFGGRIDEGNFDILNQDDKSRYPVCVFPWTIFTILWDGWVSHCMVDVEETFHGNGRVPEQSIVETLNHPGLVEYRRCMKDRDFSALGKRALTCGTCNWLFHLRAQSMNYLTLNTKRVAKRYKIDNPLEILVSSREHLYEGLLNYLEGNLGEAFKNFHFAREIARTDADREKAASWIENCSAVLRMRRNLEDWEDVFRSEGTTMRDLFKTKFFEPSANGWIERLDENKF